MRAARERRKQATNLTLRSAAGISTTAAPVAAEPSKDLARVRLRRSAAAAEVATFDVQWATAQRKKRYKARLRRVRWARRRCRQRVAAIGAKRTANLGKYVAEDGGLRRCVRDARAELQ